MRTLFALVVFSLAASEAFAFENWTMSIENNKIICQQSELPIDFIWDKLNNTKIGPCTLDTTPNVLVRGFKFDCKSSDGSSLPVMMFRSKRDCLVHVDAINANRDDPPLSTLAPSKVKDKIRWVETFRSCMTNTVSKENIDGGYLQVAADGCLCVSSKQQQMDEMTRKLISNRALTEEEVYEKAKNFGEKISKECVFEALADMKKSFPNYPKSNEVEKL